MALSKLSLGDTTREYTDKINDNLSELDANKVAVETGKGLSANDYSDEEKKKLSEISIGANKVAKSSTNGNILIDGTETTVYEAPDLDKTDITTALGYTPAKEDVATTNANGLMSSDDKTKLDGIEANAQANKIESVKVNGVAQAILSKAVDITVPTKASDISAISTSEKGVASGVATLDSNGLVPSSQLPSYVDDVLEYTSKSEFPTTGETGKIYVATDTNLTYRWSGTAYVEISASLALGETSSTAYAGSKGKANRDDINNIIDGTQVVGKATNDGNGNNIANTYATKDTTIAGVNLADNITKTELLTALNVADGAQVNKLETIQANGTAVTPTSKAINIKAGTNITLSVNENEITINGSEAGTALTELTFTSTDSNWSALTDGVYTLTISSILNALAVKKLVSDGLYSDVMASVTSDGSNIKVITDTKFSGKVIAY